MKHVFLITLRFNKEKDVGMEDVSQKLNIIKVDKYLILDLNVESGSLILVQYLALRCSQGRYLEANLMAAIK